MKTTRLVIKLGVLLLLFTTPACKKTDMAKSAQSSKAAVETLVSPDQILVHAGSIRGSVDGPALQARFDCPTLISVGPDKSLYVYDAAFFIEAGGSPVNRSIRKISCLGVVTTFYKVAVQDADITGMAVDKDGSVYISQQYQIKKISADGKKVKVVAGTDVSYPRKYGPALETTFFQPAGLAINKSGCLFIFDRGYNELRLLSNNKVTFVAGGNNILNNPEPSDIPKDGVGANAEFDRPEFLSIDKEDNLYTTGGYFSIIRKVTPNGEVSTIAVQNLQYDSDYYRTLTQIAIDGSGNLYTCYNNAAGFSQRFVFYIYKFTPDNQKILLAESYYQKEDGDDPFLPAGGLLFPTGFAIVNDTLYFSNTVEHKIRKIPIN
ncbi:hypothetical protein [Mucilaginibacter aquariorum]|uniref:Teneurin NHL domain-containing protein n=1 Tax=Mucilaginibacter aquariorum TaxID=2967225 RepID=A0ABT1TAE5_9SPHI|nr:hypothetical protein [Mucilaginibacter aquariorum]MCQ6961591.1 hypothetical protein [Mucilaginibacter aquariorum]